MNLTVTVITAHIHQSQWKCATEKILPVKPNCLKVDTAVIQFKSCSKFAGNIDAAPLRVIFHGCIHLLLL